MHLQGLVYANSAFEYIYIYIYTYIYIYMYIYIHTYMHTYTHTCRGWCMRTAPSSRRMKSADAAAAAYVSIRQHTSAYVSIRQHPYASSAFESEDEERRRSSSSCSSSVSICTFVVPVKQVKRVPAATDHASPTFGGALPS